MRYKVVMSLSYLRFCNKNLFSEVAKLVKPSSKVPADMEIIKTDISNFDLSMKAISGKSLLIPNRRSYSYGMRIFQMEIKFPVK